MNVCPPMRRIASLLATGLLVLGLGATAVVSSPATSEARVGGRAPRFTLPAVPGGPTRGRVRMTDHIGEKPIVILFWATWCQPCRQELPLYQRLYRRFHDDLVVVAISMDSANTLQQAGPMARRLGLTFPVVSDLDSAVTTRVNPRRAAPFSVWIDRRGRIVREREGYSMSEREEIVRGIVRLVRRR